MLGVLGLAAPDAPHLRPIGLRPRRSDQAERGAHLDMRHGVLQRALRCCARPRAGARARSVSSRLVARLAREHGGELPAKVVRVLYRAGEARGRPWADGGAPRRRRGTRDRRGTCRRARPRRAQRVSLWIVTGTVAESERQRACRPRPARRQARALVALVVEMEDPLLAVRAPVVRSHRHEHRHARRSRGTRSSGSARPDRARCATGPR